MDSFLFAFALAGLIDVAQAMTLKEALDRVSEHPLIKAQDLSLEQASSTQLANWLKLTPSVSGSKGWKSTQGLKEIDQSSLNLSASLNLFNGFRDYSGIRAGRHSFEAQKHGTGEAIMAIELLVANQYLDCVSANRSILVAEEAVRIRNETADIAKKLFRQGRRGEEEYIRLQSDANSEAIFLFSQQSGLKQCMESLRYWTGAFDQVEEPRIKVPMPEDEEQWKRITDETFILQHPLVKSQKRRVEAARWERRSARYFLLPSLDFSYTETPKTSFQTNSKSWLLTATWTIYSHGNGWLNVQKKGIQLRQSENKLRDLKDTLRRDFRKSLENLINIIETYRIQERNLNLIRKVQKIGLQKFRRGQISANELALDQSRVINASISLKNLWLSRLKVWLSFYRLRGGRISDLL